METKILTQEEIKHAEVLTNILRSYAENDKAVYDMINTTLSLVMSVEFINTRELSAEDFYKQRNLITHFQKELTKQIVSIH